MSFIINTALFMFVSIIVVMKNILILTDFSDKSWNSILYALGLFQNEECNFYLLNAANRFENELVSGINNQVEIVEVVNKRDQKRKLDSLIEKINFLKGKGTHTFIPIVDENRTLKGIVTNRDLRFEHDNNRPIVEVMTSKNLVTASVGTSLQDAEIILQQYKIEKLLIVDEHYKLSGLITFRDITKLKLKPMANKDAFGRLRVAAAIGVTADAVERTEALVNAGVDAVVIDTAHGHTKGVVSVLKDIKAKFPNLDVIVGNIATGAAAKYLVEAGADAVKVGIGPGSICTSRVIAGVGFPQFSAVLEVAAAIKGTGVPVIADGGIRYTGDIPKAIAAGADSVMLGSLLAGTKESPGETIIYEGRKFKSYRGMGSVEAMKQGSKDRYFQDVEDDIKKLVPEGIVGRVPYKGDLYESIHQFIGGLRAGMGYCGAKDIEALKENGQFVKITASGINESHPHDVTITNESPNYSR